LKTKEIRDLGYEELQKRLEEAYRELFDLRFKAATKQLKNHRELPAARKTIARMKTVLLEKEQEIR
jgi:large subunit ribosomal protein L29